MPPSRIRMNFHDESEAGINKQINLELYSSYVYASMATYFDRDDVALGNFAKYLRHQSDEEREHAKMLIHYQNLRGGRVVMQDVKVANCIDFGQNKFVLQKPEKDEWGTAADALETALALEKKVNQSLLDLHKIASDHSDAQMCDYLEGNFLKEQVESIHEISTIITELKRAGPVGLGEYLWDKTTMKDKE